MSHKKSHWRTHQDKSSESKMTSSTLILGQEDVQQQTIKLLVSGVNLDFNKTVSDTALDQHFYALNPFSLHTSKPTHSSF